MNPREFLQFAVEIGRSKQPARTRSAISRAYYAAFHVVAEFLEDLGLRASRGPGGQGDIAILF